VSISSEEANNLPGNKDNAINKNTMKLIMHLAGLMKRMHCTIEEKRKGKDNPIFAISLPFIGVFRMNVLKAFALKADSGYYRSFRLLMLSLI
jgi:hypothetical protein